MALDLHDLLPIVTTEQEHEALRGLLDEVRRVLEAREWHSAGVRGVLVQLRQQLFQHFTHEEQGGYFSTLVAAAPQLANRARALENEHRDLLVQVDQLLEAAALAGHNAARRGQIRLDYAGFVRLMERHEVEEDRLIQEANGHELGSGD